MTNEIITSPGNDPRHKGVVGSSYGVHDLTPMQLAYLKATFKQQADDAAAERARLKLEKQ